MVLNCLLVCSITLLLTLLPTKVASQSCAAKCDVWVYNGEKLVWWPKSFSTTITAATVVQIINTDLHITSLSTQYNEIPVGYTVPTNTNAQGTQTVAVTYARSDRDLTTYLAFPTPFNSFPQEVFWKGTLATTNAAGNSICSTATTTATGYVDYYSQESTFTTPAGPYGPDPGGLLFTTSWLDEFSSMGQTYKSLFTNEPALQTCSIRPVPAAAVVELTARFITATTVSYVGGGSSASSSTPKPAAVMSSESEASASAAPEPSSTGSSPATQTITSAFLSTVVSQGPSGPVTSVNTVLITNPVAASGSASTAASSTVHTNNTSKRKSSMTMIAWTVGFVPLVLSLCT